MKNIKPFYISLCLSLLLSGCKDDKQKVISRYSNGNIEIEVVQSDTPNVYYRNSYFESGKLQCRRRYADSLENGEQVCYYESGKIAMKGTMRNGKLNGPVFEFNKNGKPLFAGVQADGKLVGRATHYHENGMPRKEYFYREGAALLVNLWDQNGSNLIEDGSGMEFSTDELTFKSNGIDSTIKVSVITSYKDSLPDGPRKYYSTGSDKLVLEQILSKGNVVSEKKFY